LTEKVLHGGEWGRPQNGSRLRGVPFSDEGRGLRGERAYSKERGGASKKMSRDCHGLTFINSREKKGELREQCWGPSRKKKTTWVKGPITVQRC